MAADQLIIAEPALQTLVELLRTKGYTVLGPVLRDGAIGFAEITGLDQLPRGWGDLQEPGRYRVRPREDDALFGYSAPAQSAKRVLFPPVLRMWRRCRIEPGCTVEAGEPAETGEQARPTALFGIRACDLQAIRIQDRVLDGRAVVDVDYRRRRENLFLVAVACAEPGGTCFCASLGTGPRPSAGYDLALTELLNGEHRFLAESGSPLGAELLRRLPGRPATPADLSAAARIEQEATARMGRRVDTAGLRDALYAAAGSPRWEQVAERCLACTGCTLVCPTCFCTSVDDRTDLTGSDTERHRVWDSCFSAAFSAVHGHSVRAGTAARYRQWVTHKFAAWQDQFQSIGCVGCGRCITWCPAGIDLTAELAAVRGDGSAGSGRAAGPAQGGIR